MLILLGSSTWKKQGPVKTKVASSNLAPAAEQTYKAMKNGPYELVKAPEDYPGKKYRGRYCYEHHLVWWQETGELPDEEEVIHHANGDKRDNRIENLVLMGRDEHASEHAESPETIEVECANCGDQFDRLLKDVKYKRGQGQEDFYCDRSCAASDFGRGRPK